MYVTLRVWHQDAIKLGSHLPLVNSLQAQNCVLEMPQAEGLFGVDGESVRYRGGRITVECVPKAFRQFVPVGAKAAGSE